jgi:predicted RecB family nuclease
MANGKSHTIAALPRLSSQVRQALREAGILTLDQIVALHPDDLRRVRGIKSTAESIHAHARAFVEDRPVWIAPLAEAVRVGGWHMDIETTPPANDAVWSIGWCESGSEATTGSVQVAVVQPGLARSAYVTLADGRPAVLVPDADTAWRAFAASTDDGRAVFHWSPFDYGVMRNHAPPDVQACLHGRMIDLCAVYNRTVRCPLPNSSIKTVGPYVGCARQIAGDWYMALMAYRAWLRDQSMSGLLRACAYLEDDVIALWQVWRWLVGNAP